MSGITEITLTEYYTLADTYQAKLARDMGIIPQTLLGIIRRGAKLTKLADGRWAILHKSALIFDKIE